MAETPKRYREGQIGREAVMSGVSTEYTGLALHIYWAKNYSGRD